MFVVRKPVSLAAAALFYFSFSSCTWVRQVTGEEQPGGLSSTGLGAATGAVVGTGVGALIGSQSGNVGAGAAIGGLSGAAFGGALGQQESRELASKEERNGVSVRQEELLKANRNRINEYKKGSDISSERRGSLASPNSFSRSTSKASFINTPSGYRGNPRAVKFSEFDTSPDVVIPKSAPQRTVVVARADEHPIPKLKILPNKSTPMESKTSSKLISKTSQVDLVPEVQTIKVEQTKITPVLVPEQKLSAARSVEAPMHVADDTMKTEISKATATNGIVGVPVQPNKENNDPVTEEIKTTVITGSKVGKAGADDDCSRADQEYQRATTSISDADKLFYLRRALRLCSPKPNLHLATGRVYSKLGRVEDAEYEYRQVLDLEPGNSEAAKELASLKQGIR